MVCSQPGGTLGAVIVLFSLAAGWLEADETENKRPSRKAKPAMVDTLGDALPDGARMRFGTLRFRHPSSVIDLALSPDEKTLITIGSRQLILWDAESGKERWRVAPREIGLTLPGASYGIHSLVFADDSSIFYTPGGPSQIFAWDVQSGEKNIIEIRSNTLFSIPVFGQQASHRIRSIDVTADGSRFAVGSAVGLVVVKRDGTRLFSIPNKPKQPVEDEEMNRDRLTFGGHYTYARFSPDEFTLAAVSSEEPKILKFYDSTSGKELQRISLKEKLVRFAFVPDGRQVVVTERDSAIRMYSVESGKATWAHVIKPKNNAESYTAGVAVSPDGKTVAACAPIGSENLIYLLSAQSGEVIERLHGHTWKPWAVAFSSDNRTLYSAGWDGPIRRWNVPAGKQLDLPQGVRATGVVAATPDGDTFAFVDDTGVIHVVRADAMQEVVTLQQPGVRYSKIVFSPDQERLAVGGVHEDQVHVAIWNLRDGLAVQQWEWPKGADPHSKVEDICFSPDGSRLAVAVFRQSMAYLWDLTNGRQIGQLRHGDVYGLSFSPDSATLATAGWDKMIRRWHTETGQMATQHDVSEFGDDGDLRMYTIKYAPDGKLVATAHLDGVVRIWDPSDLKLKRKFRARGDFIYGSIRFSRDGTWLAIGCQNGEVSIWDPRTGEKMCVLGSHQSYVYDVNFGSTSAQVLTGGSDGVCYLWEVAKPEGFDTRPDRLWENIGSDGAAAFHAMNQLLAQPDEAIELFGRKVRPDVVESEAVQEWIEDLNSKDDVTRTSARENLLAAGTAAGEPLKVALKEADSREPLLEWLIAQADATGLAERRAVSVLSKIDSRKGRLLLKGWASQNPKSPLGLQASEELIAP